MKSFDASSKFMLFAIFCLFMPIIAYGADQKIQFDFSSRPDASLATSGGATEFSSGVMKFAMDGHCDLVIPQSYTQPFSIGFKMKSLRFDKDSSRFTIELKSNSQNSSLLVFSNEKEEGFFVIFTENGKQRFYDFHRFDVMSPADTWKNYRLDVTRKKMDLHIDGKQVFSKDITFFPVDRVLLARNKCELEFDDLTIEPAAAQTAGSVHPASASDTDTAQNSDKKITFDFSSAPDPSLARYGGATKFADGVMKFAMEGHCDLIVPQPYTRPFQISFSMTPKQADYSRSRITLQLKSNEPDTSLLIFSKEDGQGVFAIYTEKGVQRYYDYHACDVMATLNVVKGFRLVISETSIECFINDKLIFAKKALLLPVKEIALSRNGCELEFDDFQIIPSARERTDYRPTPFIFLASDKVRDQINSDGTPLVPVDGEAVLTPEGAAVSSTLTFKAEDIFRNQAGCIMFWASLSGVSGGHNLLSLDDGVSRVISIEKRPWEIQALIRRSKPLPDYEISRGIMPWQGRKDWAHIALTWEKEQVRLYVNSMPYSTIHYDQSNIQPLANKDIESIHRLRIPAGILFDDLKVYRRPVSAGEIYAEYRSRMPVDLVMQRQMFSGDKPVSLVLNTGPAGSLMYPPAADVPPPHSSEITLSTVLCDVKSGRQLLQTPPQQYKIEAQTDIPLPDVKLENGNYLLTVDVRHGGNTFRRSFKIDVYTRQEAIAEGTARDYGKGREIYSCDFKSTKPTMLGNYTVVTRGNLSYIEGTDKKFDRFGFEVPFPDDVIGKPVLIEIDWPDDKPRLAAHYIYRPSQGYCDRDRLQQGVQSGVEFPLTGKTVTTRYIFWPGFQEYLFEFRNLAVGRQAAVSALRIYEIKDGKLPALKVTEPPHLPSRRVGHLDEDQTFYMNLNRDYYDNVLLNKNIYPNYDAFVYEELGKYFAYTGMNSFLYNLLRYHYIFYMTDTNIPPGFPPAKAGGLDYMLESLKQRGISFICGINLSSIPEVAHSPVTNPDAVKSGWIMGDCSGRTDGAMFGARYPNFPTNPEIMRLYLEHIKRTAEILKKHDNVTGFALWTVPWKKLTWGYDDYNISLFSKETGIAVPERNRYQYLTETRRREWLRWRADKTTQLLKALADTLHAANPEWVLYIFPQDEAAFLDPVSQSFSTDVDLALDRRKYYYDNMAMDLDAIEALDKVYFTPQVKPSHAPERIYQFNKLEPINELVYSYQADRELFRKEGRSRQMNGIYHDYFESIGVKHPSPTLLPEKYSCFFQDTDVKPWGRYFLKELTYGVAASDSFNITFGAQPLGALGREAEVREFVQAYRALPAIPFKNVPEADDPVTVRYLQTPNGTYFYLASMLWAPCKVKITFSKNPGAYIDLSSGQRHTENEIEMDTYQLRSFLVPEAQVSIISVRLLIPGNISAFYADALAGLKKGLSDVVKIKGEKAVNAETLLLNRIKKEIGGGRYAEAHRLIFSVRVQQFMNSAGNISYLSQQEDMLRRDHIAIDCGSDEFYRAPNGALFFPDQRFDGTVRYGYFGRHMQTTRSIEKIKEREIPGIYANEAFDIDGYKFRVSNGKYTVKLYLRYGYEPDFKDDGRLKFSVKANENHLIKELDCWKISNGDFWKPTVLEFSGIEVDNGMLTVEFIPIPNSAKSDWATVRHACGMEVIKQ